MRLYILISFILFSFSLSGQHMMLAGGTEAAPPVGDLLLDNYPGAAAAYSLRELSTAWAGQDVIRVRESGSDTEQDFNAAEITDGTLATFCGANDGFVVTWYDQSGNGNDAVQVTEANQPKIVDNGSLITKNGKVSVEFDGFNDFLNVNAVFTLDVNLSAFTVSSTNSNTNNNFIYDNSNILNYGGGYSCRYNSTGSILLWSQDATKSVNAGIVLNGTQYLISQISTTSGGENNTLYQDGNQAGNNFGTPRVRIAKSNTYIGASELLGGNLNGQIQELIAYPSNQSANRTGIELNINTYYNIY